MANETAWYFKAVDRFSAPTGRMKNALAGLNREQERANRAAEASRRSGLDRISRAHATSTRGMAASLRGLNRELARANSHSTGLLALGEGFRNAGNLAVGAARTATGAVMGIGAAALRVGALGVVGIGALARGVVGVHREAQNARLQIGGMLVANRAVGEASGTERMARGMSLAEGVMARVRRDAAALPGETEDYVTILQRAMGPALSTGERSLNRIVDLTDTLGAVGISMGIDAPQIGRDISLMLRGRAGAANATFSNILPQIQQAARDMGIQVRDANQFNQLTGARRFELIERASREFAPMLRESARSWDAQWGTLVSTARDVFRRVTGPLFARMSTGLASMNRYLESNGPAVEAFFGSLIDRGASVLSWLWDLGQRALPTVRDMFNRLGPVLQNLWTTISPHLGPLATSLLSLAGGLGRLGATLIEGLTPILPTLIDGLTRLAGAIESIVDWIERTIPGARPTERGPRFNRATGQIESGTDFVMGGERLNTRIVSSFDNRMRTLGTEIASEGRKATPAVPGATATGALQQVNHTAVTVNAQGAQDPAAVGSAVQAGVSGAHATQGNRLLRNIRGTRP